MKIPFNIKFRPQIESGEYKVGTFSGYPVTVYRWDFNDGAQTPIIGSYVFEDGKEYVGAWDEEGHFDLMSPNDLDLFLITPWPELSEDERIMREILETLRYGLACEESVLMPGATTTLKEATAYLEKQKDEAQRQFNLGVQAGKEEALYEMEKEQKPLSTEETELNSIAFLEQLGYTCVPPGAEQKTAEWSEEEANKIHFLERLIQYNVPDGNYCMWNGNSATKAEAIEMLKSFKPMSSWKPSERQIKAIDMAIRFVTDDFDGHPTLSETLRGLHNDLLKLL